MQKPGFQLSSAVSLCVIVWCHGWIESRLMAVSTSKSSIGTYIHTGNATQLEKNKKITQRQKKTLSTPTGFEPVPPKGKDNT